MKRAWCLLCLLGCDDGGDADVDAGLPADAAMVEVDAGPSDAAGGPDAEPSSPSGPCSVETRVGGFVVQLKERFTSVFGQVTDAVDPAVVLGTHGTEGACRLLRPRVLFCDPGCATEQACAGEDRCVDRPQAVDVGTVVIEGLAAPVEMTPIVSIWYYTFTGDLPHPGFEVGDELTLNAGSAEAFTLVARGVEPLEVGALSVALEAGQDATVEWTVPADPSLAGLRIVLNIANHGGTPARIVCGAPDTVCASTPSPGFDTIT